MSDMNAPESGLTPLTDEKLLKAILLSANPDELRLFCSSLRLDEQYTYAILQWAEAWRKAEQAQNETNAFPALQEAVSEKALEKAALYQCIQRFMKRAGLRPPQVYGQAGIKRNLWQYLSKTEDATTGKRNLLKISVILHLDYFEMVYLVNLGGYSFLPHSDVTDHVVGTCIQYQEYRQAVIDELLVENGAEALFSEL